MNAPKRYALCACGAPLVPSMHVRKHEFYCLDCGRSYGLMEPSGVEATPEIEARFNALIAEWNEHVGDRLIVPGAWRQDCSRCSPSGKTHDQHATGEEWEADREARVWMAERIARPCYHCGQVRALSVYVIDAEYDDEVDQEFRYCDECAVELGCHEDAP